MVTAGALAAARDVVDSRTNKGKTEANGQHVWPFAVQNEGVKA